VLLKDLEFGRAEGFRKSGLVHVGVRSVFQFSLKGLRFRTPTQCGESGVVLSDAPRQSGELDRLRKGRIVALFVCGVNVPFVQDLVQEVLLFLESIHVQELLFALCEFFLFFPCELSGDDVSFVTRRTLRSEISQVVSILKMNAKGIVLVFVLFTFFATIAEEADIAIALR